MKTAFRMSIPADAAVVNPQTKAIEIAISMDTIQQVWDRFAEMASADTQDGTLKALRSAAQSALSLFVIPWMDRQVAAGNLEGFPRVDYSDPLAKSDFLKYGLNYLGMFVMHAIEDLNYQGTWSVEDETVVVTGLVSASPELAAPAESGATDTATPDGDVAATEPDAPTAPSGVHSSIVTG